MKTKISAAVVATLLVCAVAWAAGEARNLQGKTVMDAVAVKGTATVTGTTTLGTANITNIEATSGTITTFDSTVATITTGHIATVNATTGTVTTLNSTTANLTTGNITTGALGTLSVTTPTTVDYLLASGSYSVASYATSHTIYTVPAGKTAVVRAVIVRGCASSLDQGQDPVWSIGYNSTDFNDVVASATYTHPAATTTYHVLEPKVGAAVGVAGATLKVNVTTGGTATVTCTFSTFGYLF